MLRQEPLTIAQPPAIKVQFAEIDKVTTAPDPTPAPSDKPKPAPHQPSAKPPSSPESRPQEDAKPAPIKSPEPAEPPDMKEKPAESREARAFEKTPPAQTETQSLPETTPVPVRVPDQNRRPEETKDFQSVLRNLAPNESDSELMEKPETSQSESESPANAPLSDRLTISEQDALRRQLEQCWVVPVGARDVHSTVVEIRLRITRDRHIQSAEIVDKARYNRDSFYRALADSALRALRNPACSPLRLPPDKYDQWKTITVRFNPRDMF